ncbi:MAG: hypothetical protein NT159_19395 [Proteobacteria bacterium]|nr:hypothetical protein [Pseudomonadota bacterium]
MTSISILDGASKRKKRLASTFQDVGCQVRTFGDNDPIAEHSTDLLLVHYGNDSDDVLKVTRSVVVYFGGGGEPDGRWASRKDRGPQCHSIWRAVAPDGSSGYLTSAEAMELVAFISDIKEGGSGTLPAFLQTPPDYSLLVALCILCQGYLAVYAPEMLALDDQLKRLVEERSSKAKVGGAMWWLGALGEIPDNDGRKILPQEDISDAVRRLEERLKRECKWPDETNLNDRGLGPVKIMLESLTSSTESEDRLEDGVVRCAFSAIDTFLAIR